MEQANRRAVIYTGGECKPELIPIEDKSDRLIIAADCGCRAALRDNVTPSVIIGDMDSTGAVPKEFESVPLIKAPAEKDETDTMLAVQYAISQNVNDILIIGGTGGRADHTLSNIFLLENLVRAGLKVVLSDGENRLQVLINDSITLHRVGFRYFSILALEDCRVTMTGCKYPLEDKILTRTNPYAVSNEISTDAAYISIRGTAVIAETGFNDHA